ncbi:phage major capsid protein [Dermabacteraceae bacterium P13077]
MAEQTAATKLSDFSGFLQPDVAAPIFQEAARSSVVMSLTRQVPLGLDGSKIPVVTSRPSAAWVGEGDRKKTTNAQIGLKTIEAKKLTAISVVSAEVVRRNPGGYVEMLKSELASAFARAFDLAALHNKGGDGTGTGPFETYIAKTSKEVTLGTATADKGGLYGDLVAGMALLQKGTPKKRVTGFAFDDIVESDFLGAVDKNGRPLFNEGNTAEPATLVKPGRLLNRPAFMGDGVASDTHVGFAGDWTKAVWGVTSGISYRTSTDAAVTIGGQLVSLFENNLIAILAEAEYGFLCADEDAFVKFKPVA